MNPPERRRINPPTGGRRDQYGSPCRRASRALQYFGGEQPKGDYLEKSADRTDISRCRFPMIIRRREMETLRGLLKKHRVAGIVGARQVGKTTLAHTIATHAGAELDLLVVRGKRRFGF